jgi:RimJ/RimL family protein N-acetyltransferase
MKGSVTVILRTPTAGQAAALAPHLPATHALLDGDRLVGGISLSGVRPGSREIGIWVMPEERRRGVATRAVRALSEHAGERLEFVTDITDTTSQRVALGAGFTREAVRRGGRLHAGDRRDEVLWARLPGDAPGPIARLLPDLPDGELRDGEVSLRPLGPPDVDDLLGLLNLPDVRATSPIRRERPRAEIARRCTNAASEWLAGNRADFTIRVNDAFAGDIVLSNEALGRQAMVGYGMLRGFRGRGVATRAVTLLGAWAFEVGVKRLVAGTFADNTASQRVLAKAGFVREAIQRSRFEGADGTRIDDVMHVLLPGRG